MSRFGFTLWSPNSEVFVMGVVGMVVSCAGTPLYSIRPDVREVWNLDLPPERFSVALQYVLRLILINVIIVRFLTIHCYVISFLLVTWPVFLEEQPWMLLPWLVVGGVKHIVLELVVLLTGSFMFTRYGSPFNVYCLEFLLIKGVTLAFSIYLWVSVLFLYCDLANPPQMFSRDETSSNKRLEVAIRRRMCKSLCTEVVWRRRMLEDLDTSGVVHVTVSLEEDLMTDQLRTKPQTRSLDSILDQMGYDWDLLDDLSTRRALEGKGSKVPLAFKARQFLQLSKDDIAKAKQKRFSLKDTEEKSTQTNTLSKKFLDAYSKQSMMFAKSRGSSGMSAEDLGKGTESELLAASPIPRLTQKFSPVTLRPEMAERGPAPARAEKRVHSLLKNLNITIPPRYGYRHASTQVNNISRKYLDEDTRARQQRLVSSESAVESDSQWTPVMYADDSFISSLTGKRSSFLAPEHPTVIVSLCSDSESGLVENSSSSLVSGGSTSVEGPVTPEVADGMSTSSSRSEPSAGMEGTYTEREVPAREEATPGPANAGRNNEGKDPTKKSTPSVYTAILSESKSPFVIGEDVHSRSEGGKWQRQNTLGDLETEMLNVVPTTKATDSSPERGSKVSAVDQTRDKSPKTTANDTQAKQGGKKGKKGIEKTSWLENNSMLDSSKGKKKINNANKNSDRSASVMEHSESTSAGSSNSDELSWLKSEPAPIKKHVSTLSPSVSAAWSSLEQRELPSRSARVSPPRGVATDNAVAGTSRDSSVYSLSLLESDYAFGVAPDGTDANDVSRQRVLWPPPKPHRSISKPFNMDSRPSIRTIKRYANAGPLKTSDGTYYDKTLPPVTLSPQQTKRLGVENKRPERATFSNKQIPNPSQKVSLAIDVSDPTPTENRRESADSATSEVAEENTWAGTSSLPQSPQSNETYLIKKAMAFNEEKLQMATRKHESGRPTLVLQLLADDDDFDFALPQTSQTPIKRDSSGSLNEFLDKMKRADTKNRKE